MKQKTSRVVDQSPSSVKKIDEGLKFKFEWGALQPQRLRFVKPQIYVRAKTSSKLSLMAKVYADSFSEPIVLHLSIKVIIRNESVKASLLVPNLSSIQATTQTVARWIFMEPGCILNFKV